MRAEWEPADHNPYFPAVNGAQVMWTPDVSLANLPFKGVFQDFWLSSVAGTKVTFLDGANILFTVIVPASGSFAKTCIFKKLTTNLNVITTAACDVGCGIYGG